MNLITALPRALFLTLLLAVALPVGAIAQEAAEYDTSKVVPPPRYNNTLSPMDISSTMLGDTYVKVVYGSPRMREREIFGDLVPYGELWRTGANEATELTTTGDLDVNGQTLPAGTYAVFTIPGEEMWTVVFNSALGQLGAADYDESKDVLRVEVPVMETEKPYEGFTIMFEDTAEGKALAMAWDDTKVALPVQAKAM
ncbi:MAG: DUF2911 domain-containing protein [Rhodothermales bacterium]